MLTRTARTTRTTRTTRTVLTLVVLVAWFGGTAPMARAAIGQVQDGIATVQSYHH